MRKTLFAIVMALLPTIMFAGATATSAVGSLYIGVERPKTNLQRQTSNTLQRQTSSLSKYPAILTILPNSIEFIDETDNNAIDANERCKIRMVVKNEGKGDGVGCKVTTKTSGTIQGISYNSNIPFEIGAGETKTLELPISSNMQTTDGKAVFTLQLDEPNGFGTDPFDLTVVTKSFEQPLVKVVDHSVTGEQSNTLEKKKAFDLQLLIQNTKYGRAEDVDVSIELPKDVLLLDGANGNIGILDGGEKTSLVYSLIANNNYSATSIPIKVNIREKYGKYAETKVIDLAMNQTFASKKIQIEEKTVKRDSIEIAMLSSKVDKSIPQSNDVNNKTFAVIIANEHYRQVEKVPYALNDGNIFKQYCEKTLGIPSDNISFSVDATLGKIKQEIKWLKDIMSVYRDSAKIIFYYAGHGIPDEETKASYLLPVDGSGSDVSTAYKLDDLYRTLGTMPSESVTIFLDACFSGSKREEGMLASARGVAIKAKSGVLRGNMVVFSAATEDQTAYPYNEEKHGMFTYYLLEKLQKTSGDCTLSELGEYIKDKVGKTSVVKNKKSQTPTVNSSIEAVGWEEWKLK